MALAGIGTERPPAFEFLIFEFVSDLGFLSYKFVDASSALGPYTDGTFPPASRI